MAIAIDTATNSGVNASVSSFSWSHTVGSGTNRGLEVNLQFRDSSLADIGASGVTFNGVAMTKLKGHKDAAAAGNIGAEIWYLPAPSVGNLLIAVTLNGTCDHATGEALSLFNVQQVPVANATQQGF